MSEKKKKNKRNRRSKAKEKKKIVANIEDNEEIISLYLKCVMEGVAKPDKDEKKEVGVVVKELEQEVLLAMKNSDRLFQELYTGQEITGSVKKGLKVEKPNEYDVNLGLQLCLKKNNSLKIHPLQDEHAGWFHLTFNKRDWNWPVPRQRLRKGWRALVEVSRDNAELCFLNAAAVRNWISGIMHRALRTDAIKKMEEKLGIENLKQTQSGPAVTLKFDMISKDSRDEVSIDFVACISIPEWCTPQVDAVHLDLIHNQPEKKFHLVPVPPKSVKDPAAPEYRNMFRGTYPTYEDALLKDKESLKNVIRLLKVTRNRLGWSPLASFYIMNICWNWNCKYNLERKKSTQDVHHLQQSNIAQVFIGCLREMQECLSNKELKMTLFPKCNLFAKLKEDFCANSGNRLRRFLRNYDEIIRKDPNPRNMLDLIETLFKNATNETEDQEDDERMCLNMTASSA